MYQNKLYSQPNTEYSDHWPIVATFYTSDNPSWYDDLVVPLLLGVGLLIASVLAVFGLGHKLRAALRRRQVEIDVELEDRAMD